MTFWDTTNPKKPRGIKDPNSVLDFPIDFTDWFADSGETYQDHEILTTGGLVCDTSSHDTGVIVVILSGGNLGEVATFTVRVFTANGLSDDRTFYLKIEER